jgi:hypothetical protein
MVCEGKNSNIEEYLLYDSMSSSKRSKTVKMTKGVASRDGV